MPVIGFLSSRSPGESAGVVAAFRQGLSEAGFVEGQNVIIAFRWAEGRYDRLPALAANRPRKAPPGRFRLSTKPSRTGLPPNTRTIGIVEVAALAATAEEGPPAATITATRWRTRSAANSGSRSYSFCAQRYSIATFWASISEALRKSRQEVCETVRRCAAEDPDHRHRLLLRTRRHRPRRRAAAEQRDELAPSHYSITSSASCGRCMGTSRPKALAVLRLMTS
jgi:hypothetical protein